MTKPPASKPLYTSLYFQVLVAVTLGMLLWMWAPASAYTYRTIISRLIAYANNIGVVLRMPSMATN